MAGGDEVGLVITVYLCSALVAGVLGGAVSQAKRRHPGYWMTLSFLFPPLVIILLLLPKGHGHHDPMREPGDDCDSLDD